MKSDFLKINFINKQTNKSHPNEQKVPTFRYGTVQVKGRKEQEGKFEEPEYSISSRKEEWALTSRRY